MSIANEPSTLAERLTEGRIPVSEALHYAMSLAEALRRLHDAGRAHGAVSPSNVALSGIAVELLPSLGPSAAVTPYTAPELLRDLPADARSDIFSFGAILYEVLTGRRAFEGDSQAELTAALTQTPPPGSGSPTVDRLVSGCLAKDPAARWQRMQKIMLELKLLTVAARRAESKLPSRAASLAQLRAEMEQLEARMIARLVAHEKALLESQQAAADATRSVIDQLSSVSSQLAALRAAVPEPVDPDALFRRVEDHVNQTVDNVVTRLTALMDEKTAASRRQVDERVDASLGATTQQLASHVNQSIAAAGEHKQQVDDQMAAVSGRLHLAEQTASDIRQELEVLEAGVAAEMRVFEQGLKVQSAAIESARTAIAQTDDLVERVVEALELLQASLLDQHEAIVN